MRRMVYNLNGDMCHPRGSDIFLYSSTAVSKMHRLLFVDYCMPHWRRCIIGPCPRFDLGQLLIQQAVYIFHSFSILVFFREPIPVVERKTRTRAKCSHHHHLVSVLPKLVDERTYNRLCKHNLTMVPLTPTGSDIVLTC